MRDRKIIVIMGNQLDCLSQAKKITANLDCLFLEDQKKAPSFLGQEFDAVIFDCHLEEKTTSLKVGGCASPQYTFDPNAFGAITGTIRGGGYLILLKPENTETDSLFLKRFWSLLKDYENQKNPDALAPPQRITKASADQTEAIDKIIHVVKGHRRRPLVITSDRGRGKSAALGIAAAKLVEEGYKNIIICAPSKKTAEMVFKYALETNPQSNLAFYSPDELAQQKPKADLVLVDEAAAIPVSLLTHFVKHYSRIIFATTQHGYEGSGRGFAINFKKVLDKLTPDWSACQLHTPIRWDDNDKLEAFVFKALLLNAEPVEIENIASSECKILKLDKTKLINNEAQLIQLFGLLVSAHYQTKPSDLMHMLDDDLVSIHVTQYKQNIIAVALLIKEGGIDQKTAMDIFEGTRRLQGHLVAQSLAANAGIENAPCLQGERVIRIAVHPNLQQQGFGTALLKTLKQNSQVDYLSTSFGATSELIHFWQRLSFTPVYLGMKRDASSGTHSVVMLYAKTDSGETLLENAQHRFAKSFPHLLSEPFRNLEVDLVLALLSSQSTTLASKKHSRPENKELSAFAEKQRGYENTIYAIWQFVCEELSNEAKLSDKEKEILVLKVLQKHSWQAVAKKMAGSIHGKKDALLLLRKAILELIDS